MKAAQHTTIKGILALGIGVGIACPASADLGAAAVSGTGGSTTASLNFSLVVPAYLRLSIGTPTAGTIDTVTFSPTAATAGTGTAVAATYSTGGTNIPVVVQANGATGGVNLTYSATNTSIGAVGKPAWSEFSVTGTGTIAAATATALSGTANTTVKSLANVSGLVNAGDTWTFSYANSAMHAAGTYTGTITYTATEF